MAKVKTSKSKVNPPEAGRFFPTAGYVLIEPYEAETKTASGIYLAENVAGEKPQKGKVLAVGSDDGKKKSPTKVGDTVIYKKWGGNEVKENGKDYLFVKFEDILAIIK